MMHELKTRLTGKKLIALVLLAGLIYLIAPITYTAYQNYNGVCVPEGRVLTKDELIYRLVEQVNRMDNLMVDNGTRGRNILNEGITPIPYATVDAFLYENLDCCHIEERKEINTKLSDFLDRVYGSYGPSVAARFNVQYKDSVGIMRLIPVHYYGIVDNCGKVWD